MILLASAGDDDVVHILEYISADLPLEHRFGKPGESGPGVLESLRHSDEASATRVDTVVRIMGLFQYSLPKSINLPNTYPILEPYSALFIFHEFLDLDLQ
jgi:hypothetical protein